MILKDLIEQLEALPPALRVKHGFNGPQSYRGFYECLAFEPAEGLTVLDMLNAAKEALGSTYTGYKGGRYLMGEYTDCYLAKYGETGDAITLGFFQAIALEAKVEADAVMHGEMIETQAGTIRELRAKVERLKACGQFTKRFVEFMDMGGAGYQRVDVGSPIDKHAREALKVGEGAGNG